MPLAGARYRMKKTSKGPMRLAFRGNAMVEAKNMKTGAMHTEGEFRADRKRRHRLMSFMHPNGA